MSEELPRPHAGMTPEEKGELLLRYAAQRVSLEGLDFGGASLLGVQIRGANLRGVDLHGANLAGAQVTWTDLRGSMLAGANLSHADLDKSDLFDCDLRFANLSHARLVDTEFIGADLVNARLHAAQAASALFHDADLSDADLTHANLTYASLENAHMEGANLRGACLDRATVNYGTFTASRLSLSTLTDWLRRGLRVSDLMDWPAELQHAILGNLTGLTLYFNTRLHRLDRILIEGIIVIVLGRATDVDVAEYRREEENTIVRLTGSDPADLEAVANALWHRVWEDGFQQRTQLIENRGNVETQINVAGDYLAPRELSELVARLEALQKVGGDLSALRDVLERIELRLGQGEAEVRREWE